MATFRAVPFACAVRRDGRRTDVAINRNTDPGTNTYNIVFNVSSGTLPAEEHMTLHARFRLFLLNELNPALWTHAYDGRNSENAFDPPLTPPGQSQGGQVEEYMWPFSTTAVTLSGMAASAGTSPLAAVLTLVPVVALIGGSIAFARRRRS